MSKATTLPPLTQECSLRQAAIAIFSTGNKVSVVNITDKEEIGCLLFIKGAENAEKAKELVFSFIH
jgi:hypothetical protein